MSFILSVQNGKLVLHDAFLVKGEMDLECPKCKRKNEPVIFFYESDGPGVSRRYFYCCPECKIHYTDWGEKADWEIPELKIPKECKQNGNHAVERELALRLQSTFWKEVHEKTQQSQEKTKQKK
jgi:hypothetical protein